MASVLRVFVLFTAFGLAGCAGIEQFTKVTKPVDLFVLSPKSSFAPDLPEVRRQIVVEEPTAASQVNSDRIAVKPNPYQVQYYPDVRWSDRAPLMVQSLLVESFENTGKVASVGAQAIGLNADFFVLTDLREFQAEAPPLPEAPVVINVQLNIKIVKEPEGLIVASSSFSHQNTAASDELIDVIVAFDEALGKSMRDAVEWTVRQTAAIGPDDFGLGS